MLLCHQEALCAESDGPRRIIKLDGIWEIVEGDMNSVPDEFTHKVPVPGLVDMATPSFEEVGKKSQKRQAFWYRRRFAVEGEIPAVAVLKINKARYGTKVLLNSEVVGEHLPCFTPAILDIKKYLKGKGEQNELIVRVGADRECLPEGMPTGWDFEKYLYIPGIYDSVELVLTGSPHISSVQTVPQIDKKTVRVVVELDNRDRRDEIRVNCTLREVRTGKTLGVGGFSGPKTSKDEKAIADFDVPILDCRLWSPEDPFLYELELNTGGDTAKVRFGMRSFHFDKESGRAILNGKPYFMRGTNVCIFRFFEDSMRGDRPWRKQWVRQLHQKFKTMHWNSIRYCIGFPPEIWYEIADDEGFLIQDEFPIWLLDKAPENPKSELIAGQYAEWMKERWNHPCVVIWDAQNESVTEETGKAIQKVRHLDLSNRPWENGWAEPQSPTDCVEAHPYLFIKAWQGRKPFKFADIVSVFPVPYLRNAQKKLQVPIIINEYAWLWLNRDGRPTTLTKNVYESLLGPSSTSEQRRLLYARYLAAKTEFWRCHRKVAGVLHFCSLGYSRPGFEPRPQGGATSDHFLDVEGLVFEPNFEKYVRDAFSPVALMIDFWDEQVLVGQQRQIKVFVINDLYENWKGTVRFRIVQNAKIISEQSRPCNLTALGQEILTLEQRFPDEIGKYQIIAELIGDGAVPVRSLRDFEIASSK